MGNYNCIFFNFYIYNFNCIFLFAKNIPSKHATQIVTENTPNITTMPNQVTGSTTILQRVNAQRTNVYTDNFVLSDSIINQVIKQAQDLSISFTIWTIIL